jgi:hypothetical protein
LGVGDTLAVFDPVVGVLGSGDASSDVVDVLASGEGSLDVPGVLDPVVGSVDTVLEPFTGAVMPGTDSGDGVSDLFEALPAIEIVPVLPGEVVEVLDIVSPAPDAGDPARTADVKSATSAATSDGARTVVLPTVGANGPVSITADDPSPTGATHAAVADVVAPRVSAGSQSDFANEQLTFGETASDPGPAVTPMTMSDPSRSTSQLDDHLTSEQDAETDDSSDPARSHAADARVLAATGGTSFAAHCTQEELLGITEKLRPRQIILIHGQRQEDRTGREQWLCIDQIPWRRESAPDGQLRQAIEHRIQDSLAIGRSTGTSSFGRPGALGLRDASQANQTQ